jgi:hypothetical protein
MRRQMAKIGIVLLTALLLFSLSWLEIPELYTLTDDVSNDFIFQTSFDEITSPAVNAREPEAQREEIREADHREYANLVPTSITAPRSTHDLLHSISIQRE